MQATITALTAPRFTANLGGGETSYLFHVSIQLQRLGIVHEWRGWATDSQQARARASEAARNAWPGYAQCVRSVVQVGV